MCVFTCILLPILWRSSCGLCTCGSTGTQPQIPDSQTEPTEPQTPGYWRSLDYSLKGKRHTHTHTSEHAWMIHQVHLRVYPINHSFADTRRAVCFVRAWLTWRNLTHCGGVPAVALVAIRTLDKDGTVTQTLCKHLTTYVVQPYSPTLAGERKKKNNQACNNVTANFI